ncbi:MAG: hypothetical protein ACRCZI_05505 [Cetobacterium sp.]
MKTVALIDADILVYQTAVTSEKVVDWGDDLWTLHSDFHEAKDLLAQKIHQIKEDLKPDEMRFALSDPTGNYFRKAIYPKYKQNRKAVRKPLVWKSLRDYITTTYGSTVIPGLEGDDVLGIWATGPRATTDYQNRIIVSIDKDFKTIPCQYYNLTSRKTITVSFAEATYYHMFQTLTGDTADGYPGCPGIGPKTAERLLLQAIDGDREGGDWTFNESAAWDQIVGAYHKAKLGEGVALQMARCARILHAVDFDFTTKQPKLWEAPI